MKVRDLLVFVLLAFTVAACATQPPPPATGAPGFWYGLLHGFIARFALIASLFQPVRIYAYPNAGGWYDLGFILGIAAGMGGGVKVTSRRTA